MVTNLAVEKGTLLLVHGNSSDTRLNIHTTVCHLTVELCAKHMKY